MPSPRVSTLFCCVRSLAPVAAACLLFVVAGLSVAATPNATLEAIDDTDALIALPQPARRIISIAPHTTELLFAAGAGRWVVGVSRYSDYPEAARQILRVGDAERLDFEKIIALKPDLVVAWANGNRSTDIARLEELGIRVFKSEPRTLEMIATNIERLGVLTATDDVANNTAADFRQGIAALKESRRKMLPLKTFFQIWQSPLMTLNGQHLISEIITLCGGRNVFAELGPTVPQIDMEAVIQRDPEVILSAGSSDSDLETLRSLWKPFKNMAAIRQNHVYLLPADVISRQSPRVLSPFGRIFNADTSRIRTGFIDRFEWFYRLNHDFVGPGLYILP